MQTSTSLQLLPLSEVVYSTHILPPRYDAERDVGSAYVLEGWRWHLVQLSTKGAWLKIERGNGEMKRLLLSRGKRMFVPFIPRKKGFLLMTHQETVVLGFKTSRERQNWDSTFWQLRGEEEIR